MTAGNRTFQTSRCDNSKPLLKKFVRLKLLPSLSGGMNTYNAHSSQMGTRASTESSSYDRLVNRLCDKGLQALDVGGSGDCFFKAISHQYYGTPDHHIAVRHAGVSYLEQHPDLFIESVSENSWKSYLQRMVTPGTWCDNIIIQAVANQLNCVIHIIESRLSCTQGSTITPSTTDQNAKVLFVGYIEDLHYVSTIPHSNTTNKNALKYLKSKLLQSDEKIEKRNLDRRDAWQRKRKQEQTTRNIAKKVKKTCDKKQYLLTFDAEKHGDIHKQDLVYLSCQRRKMRFTRSAAVLKKFGPPEAVETAKLCEKMDAFFDCLNVRSTTEHQRKCKPFLAPYRSGNDERYV